MNNAQMAGIFHQLAGLTALNGQSAFKVRAYRRVAYAIEHYPVEVEQYVREGGDLMAIDGVGDAIARKIRELLQTGRLQMFERLEAEFPEGLLTLMAVPGVGPKTALRLFQELGISTVEGLEQAIEDGRVATLPRLGEKRAQNILGHLRSLQTVGSGL